MSTICTICRHPERAAIERALVRQIPLRKIASDVRTSIATLQRHKAHVPAKLATAEAASKIAEAGSLLKKLEEVIEDARRITGRAERKGNYQAALAGLRTITNSLELLGRVTGELRPEGGLHLHRHAHLHASATDASAMADEDLELSIARDVATATNGFDPMEIQRLKALLDALPSLPAPSREAALIEA
jgi:hypothetical protein